MRIICLFLLFTLWTASTGCSGKASEGINRDKDKPRPEPKAARTDVPSVTSAEA